MKKTYSPRDILPLEIGKYLQDTAHLDATKSGAYMHLLMHYWLHGPLPDNDECLAAVARVSEDTWRITRNTIMGFFELGPDRRWHQAGTDRRRDEAIAKYKKRQENARKAINIRWARYRANRGGEEKGESPYTNRIATYKSDSPSRFPFEVSPHTPFPNTLPLPPQEQPHWIGRARDFDVGLPALCWPEHVITMPPRRLEFPEKQSKSETDKNALQRANGTPGMETIVTSPNGGRKHGKNGGAGRLKKISDPEFDDLRFASFRREIFRFWEQQNPGSDPAPWDHHETIALASFLKLHPAADLGGFKNLLRNRARSEVNPMARPARWIADLDEFASGPLDKYRKVKRTARRL